MERGKHIIISGASGFVGAYLLEYFKSKGYKVTGLVRSEPENPIDGITYKIADLLHPPDVSVFEHGDVFIHCAYVKGEEELNVKGTQQYLQAARQAGVKKCIFISSMASHDEALSAYGKQKFQLEKEFTGNDAVVRPGLVIGEGGLFYETVNHIRTKGFVPLINGGRQPLYTVHIDDLANALNIIIEKDLNGAYYVSDSEAIVYKELYTYLAKKLGRKIRMLPISYGLLNTFFRTMERLGVKLGVGRENLLGLKASRRFDVQPDLDKLGIQPLRYRQSVDKVLG